MTDEATPTYAAMLEQLVEGHQWVAAHFDGNLMGIDSYNIYKCILYNHFYCI